jgi:CBS domain containing-hemolysin-like protein
VAADDEVIEQEERQLIESIIEFGDTVVREIMVPSPDMVTVSSDATVSSALDVAINEGFSRMPVLNAENDQDDVVGVLYAKDLMRAERQGLGVQTVMTLVRQVRVIPENKPVARLMREMQAEKFHLAIVADEYGSIAGMVTLEDCLEELVGEIVDEHDTEDAEIEHLANGEYLVEGSVSVADINELLAVNIPDEEWDTVGGFIFGTLEHVPEVGESVLLDGWKFVAHEVDGRRIRKVRIVAEVIER